MLLAVLLVLCGAQPAPGSLEVRMDGKSQIVYLNENVTIPCVLSGYGSEPLNVSIIGVRWFLRRLNSDKEDKIFEYIGGKWTQFRPGANISMSSLKRGDASLHLPHIQLEEGGKYRCEIIFPPDRVQETARLDVMAHPSSNRLPRKTVVEEKKVYMLKCTMAGFYPESIQILEKVIQGTHSLDVDNSEYIYKNFTSNNVTSIFILFPILKGNGTICMNALKSALIPSQTNNTWIGAGGATVWKIIAPVICLCFFVCVYVYYVYFRKVAPVLSPLPAREYLKHQELKTFYFVIWGYRPKPLTLKLFLKINPWSEEVLLISWRTQGTENEENLESMQLMETQARFTLSLEVQNLKCNSFGVSGILTLMSDLAAFTEADLLLQVEHSAFKTPLRRKIHLKVIAQPKLKKILCSSDHPQPGESVTLTCRIHSFFPRAVKVYWYKEDRLMLEDIEASETVETSEDGLLCSCISKLEFSPQIEDLGKKFICKAVVEGSEPVQRDWVLQTLGQSP